MSSESNSMDRGHPNQSHFPPGSYPPCYGPWMPPPPTAMGPWPPPMWPNGPHPDPKMIESHNWNPARTYDLSTSNNQKGNEYMVDSLRRIYSNEDSSIEIERVKVQRRQPQIPPKTLSRPAITFPGFSPNYPPVSNPSQCIVPFAGPQLPPERRPPPRKHRKKRLNNEVVPLQQMNNSYPQYYPYQYMPYMPYPIPYPYPYFGYGWPPANQTMPTRQQTESNVFGNQQNNLQQRSLPASPESQRLDSGTTHSIRDSVTPESGRPLSPNPPSQTSQITESQGTDIAPSDSVSVGGYCKHKSSAGQTPEWMVEMQKNLSNIDDSSEAGERSSFTTAPSDITTPAGNREIALDDDDDLKSLRSGIDLVVNLKNTEYLNSQHNKLSNAATETGNELDGRSSTTSFHSTRNTSDILLAETDSTDICVATDGTTADEDTAVLKKPPLPPGGGHRQEKVLLSSQADDNDDAHRWVLQKKEEAPDVAMQQGTTNTWLTDVSVWRARLVVSLDRGQGLDQQDWATFHLLIQHPLPLHLKLSLLHAPRICLANTNIGAVQVRTGLLQLARHAQALLQKEDDQPTDWKCITPHNNQSWMPVKGGIEILRILGYRSRDDGILKYSKRLSLESSHLARLTLDLLVFADELRLYLTGTHPHPTNISDLFCPIAFSTTVSPEPVGIPMLPDKPSSYSSSADFISAESTPLFGKKSAELNVKTINDDNSRSQSLGMDYNKQLIDHNTSSSEEVTLHEDEVKEKSNTFPSSVKNKSKKNKLEGHEIQAASSLDVPSTSVSDILSQSSDITSIPDLQSMSSLAPSRLSNVTKSEKLSDCSNLSTPIASPIPPVDDSAKYVSEETEKKEEHVYEEIGEIRAQVQKMRSSVSVPNFPPPIPPKIRSLYQDEENSVLYSRSDWSASSSIGGSMGPRRRKRRAPLPPSFLYEEQIKIVQDETDESNEINCAEKTICSKDATEIHNPFCEESETENVEQNNDKGIFKDSTKEINPFYEPKQKPSGYVGANPFYEDLSVSKYKGAQVSQTESVCEDNTLSILSTSFELQFDHSDGKTPPVPAARPKRRAPRPPNASKFSNKELIEQSNESRESKVEYAIANNHVPRARHIPDDSELEDVDLTSIHEDFSNSPPVVKNEIRKSDLSSKNVYQKHHRDSQDVVSGEKVDTESCSFVIENNPNAPEPKEITKKVEENITEQAKVTIDKDFVEIDDINLEMKMQTKKYEIFKSDDTAKVIQNKETLQSKINNIDKRSNSSAPSTILCNSVSEGELSEKVLSNNTKDSNINNVEQSSVLHNGTVKGEEDNTNQMNTEIPSNCASTELSQNVISTASDDIQFIDGEVDDYKYSAVSPKKIPFELDNNCTLPLKSSHKPPRPPSQSPPSTSPTLTPPETPHFSPPQTPPMDNSEKFDVDYNISSTQEQLINRLSKISETGEVDDCKISDLQDSHELKSPVMFSKCRNNTKDVQCKSSTYYEIPETPETPPPVPAKPSNLRNAGIFQKTPEIPPKSNTLLSRKINTSSSVNEEERYEIPDVTIANAIMAAQKQMSTNETSDKVSLSTSSSIDFANEEPRLSNLPARKRYNSSNFETPPRPPKNVNNSSPEGGIMQAGSSLNTLLAGDKSATLPIDTKCTRSMSPARPMSTPSSPRLMARPKLKKSSTDKSRKSWPFLFCDCLYTNCERKDI